MNENELKTPTQKQKQTVYTLMSARLRIDEQSIRSMMTNMLMRAKGGNSAVSNEELVTFLSIANEYQLNPLAREIYAFNNRGAIQPIVSIDGWLKIINSHAQFDGMEFEDHTDDSGNIAAITCCIYRRDRSKPTSVTEYMSECRLNTDPWRKWPVRMLRHKSTIQAARYAFGLSGIIDPDEAERYEQDSGDPDKQSRIVNPSGHIEPEPDDVLPEYTQEQLLHNIQKWRQAIRNGKSPQSIVAMIKTKFTLPNDIEKTILAINEEAAQ